MNKLMKSEVISKIRKCNFDFAWINTFSDLKLVSLKEDKLQDSFVDDLDNLIEAKFFNKETEMSIMPCENEEKFSVFQFDGKGKEYIEEKQILNKNKSPYKNKNDKLVIRNYIDYDGEGQAFIYYSKLCNVKEEVEGGGNNGK